MLRQISSRVVVVFWVALACRQCSAAEAADPNIAAIKVADGFTVELVAGPPLVDRPMLASFDDHGRLFVCDSAGVNLRGPELAKNPPHAIRMLEDTDGDGRFDKSTLYADRMMFPQGIVWHDGSVFCSSPPSFWKLTDTDGDGRADQREELATGFANTGVADDMHGGSFGPDGRIYWCAGRFPHEIRRPTGPVIHKGTAPLILRCKPDGSELEVVCGSQGNAVGVAFTREGDMFASGTFLAPNSMGAGLRDALIHCVDGGEYPVRDRTLNEHKRTGDLLPPLTHLGVSAASDLTIATSDALGEGSRGNLYSAQFNLHKILRHKLERTGATFTCRNEDFLVSANPDFHPTDVFEDADGSLLVVNTGGWFRIGCPTSQIAKPEVLGGIYRVRRANAPPVADPRGLKMDWSSLSPDKLTDLLDDSRTAVRERAMTELARHGEAAVGPLSETLAGDGPIAGKCAAVWTLARIDGDAARAAVRAALADQNQSVRQVAARVAGLHRDDKAAELLAKLVTSDTPPVRREAATALGRIGGSAAVPALLDTLATPADRFLEHAAIFALIRIGDRAGTLKGLELANSLSKRGALVALDQMDGGNLEPNVVTPFLAPTDPVLRETALWVIGHHGEWAPAMVGFFREWLSRPMLDDAHRDELKAQLVAFAGDKDVQALIGETLSNDKIAVPTRLMLLEVIGQAPITSLPDAWGAPLEQTLADADDGIVRQSVATLRALPLDKPPVVSRIDPQIDFPEVKGHFAGTRLAVNFCARWTGVIRCPREATYTFYLESDDGSELFIDGRRVVDNSGEHAIREVADTVKLSAGEHDLRLDFMQGEGEAACKLSWSFDGHEKETVPREALAHRVRSTRPRDGVSLEPGLVGEFYMLGGRVQTFPDLAATRFDPALVRVAMETSRPLELRAAAAAAVAARLPGIDPTLFEFLLSSVWQDNPPLARLDAAEALGTAHLERGQLVQVAGAIANGGVLEVPKLLAAFEGSDDEGAGQALVAALVRSQGRRALQADSLAAVLSTFPESVRRSAEPLFAELNAHREKQTARLNELTDVLAGGDIQRGRELFFANQKAICATCHTVQSQGGKIGPDLSKIGAIRTPRDLLEAIVFPSTSFARGYEPFAVVTDAGQLVGGIIVRETADAIYVVGNSRVETRVARSMIESLQQTSVSIMPEGMDNQLSRQELADLIAFLHSLQ